MSTQLRFRRGNTAATSTFVGAAAEVTVDTDLNTLVVHDGITPGGFALINLTSAQVLENKTFANLLIVTGNIQAENYNFANGISIITTLSSDIFNANLAMKSYVDDKFSSVTTSSMTDRGPDQPNWNMLTQMGVYLVERTSWSGTVGTPLDTTNYSGLLEVINTSDKAITQNYRPYNTNSVADVYWTRSFFANSSWSSWSEIVNSAGYTDGGNF